MEQQGLALCTEETLTGKDGRLLPLLCGSCGVLEVPLLAPGTGPHIAKALCSGCGRMLKWLPRALCAERKDRMGSVNKVILIGAISKYGVTVKYAPSGTACAHFALRLQEQGQDGKMHTLFQDCEVWGHRAEAVGELESGQLCLFEGRLAKRKRGEAWETVVAGFDLTPVLAPTQTLAGSRNERGVSLICP